MIDFHAHLDLYPDPYEVVRECIGRNLFVLSVTTTPSAWVGTAALVGNASRIRTGLGLHPQIVHERKGELGLFEQLLPHTRYIAEVGLDGGPEYQHSWSVQVDAFSRILNACAAAGGRILSIHSRHAATPVLNALADVPAAGVPVLHWFSGTQRELARAVQMGCWFSVGPAMLSSQKGRDLVTRMPRDRLLTETDGPFARIDGRPALPWDVARAVESIGKLWNEPADVVQKCLLSNLRSLTSL